jgi:hypothetical protein
LREVIDMSIPGRPVESESLPVEKAGGWAWACLAAAVVTAAGSLYLSLGLNLRACPLCFYQRAFALSLVGVLGAGLLTGRGRLGPLALPLAVAGLGVALFHVYLERAGALECPAGVLGTGSAPVQSLAAFALLVVLLLADVLRGTRTGRRHTLAVGVLLGGLLALGACVANPPMPGPPSAPYPGPPEICRPPFRPPP